MEPTSPSSRRNYFRNRQPPWNRIEMEAKLAEDAKMRNLPNGEIVTFGRFRIRSMVFEQGGRSVRRPSISIWIMATGEAARFLSLGKRGQVCTVRGRLVSVPVIGNYGRVSVMPRIIAQYVELGTMSTEAAAAAIGEVAGPPTVPLGAETAVEEAIKEDVEKGVGTAWEVE